MPTVLLTGDINLMSLEDPQIPFRQLDKIFSTVDVQFSILECCPRQPVQADPHEGLGADPEIGAAALRAGGIDAVGIGGCAEVNIAAWTAMLLRLAIPFAGAGRDIAEARLPVIVQRRGIRYGFLQRSIAFGASNAQAPQSGAEVAVVRGHTAYHVPMRRDVSPKPTPDRPGLSPLIVTWADTSDLDAFRQDIAALREQAGMVIASCYWGHAGEVLGHMQDIARAAIGAGADVVMGHGSSQPLPVGFHRGKPIFYGLGSFASRSGQSGAEHAGGIVLYVKITGGAPDPLDFSIGFMRRNDLDETVPRLPGEERQACERLTKASLKFGAELVIDGDRVRISQASDR